MSTRTNIILKGKESSLTLYKHCDGYPDHMNPIMFKVISLLRAEILPKDPDEIFTYLLQANPVDRFEITTGIHGDIEYLYIIDLEKATVKTVNHDFFKYEVGSLNG